MIGMLLAGMILGLFGPGLLSDGVISLSGELRELCLVIILLKAGLSLDPQSLKKVGRPALLLSFVPACFEMPGCLVPGPRLSGFSRSEALLCGAVLSAVSPAVVVPRMVRIYEEGCGRKHSAPRLVLAGASLDDVFVIVVFTALGAFFIDSFYKKLLEK